MTPRKTKITRELILNTAFEIVRDKGINAITARKIAYEINCSTQPVYSTFNNMEELKNEIVNKASEYGLSKILSYKETGYVSLDMGLGYLDFAAREKELFKILFSSENIVFDNENDKYIFDIELQIKQMRKDPNFKKINKDQIKNILKKLWIFTHGIATMLVNDSFKAPREEIITMLTETYNSLLINELIKNGQYEEAFNSCKK
ncbi:MAG: TetR/AcrR family transcriptional regulator [Firmicutes bacterium]|nr:TetR/AcrR family transcriptional regulator [Bacillota bacterium]